MGGHRQNDEGTGRFHHIISRQVVGMMAQMVVSG